MNNIEKENALTTYQDDNKQKTDDGITFQNKSADYIFKKLGLDKDKDDSKKRFLLADEVGLGKTITAAKVIDKMLEKNPDGVTRIGYICNNLSLAKENSLKLFKKSKNAKPKIIEGDRLSTFLLDYYGLSDNKNIYIFKGLSDRFEESEKITRINQYIFWLAPISDDKLLFQVGLTEEEKHNGDWYQRFSGNTYTCQTPSFKNKFLDSVYEKLNKYSKDNKKEIDQFIKSVTTTWNDQKNKILEKHKDKLPNEEDIKQYPIEDQDPVTKKLFYEIVNFLKIDLKENSNKEIKKKQNVGNFLRYTYMAYYKYIIQEQIEKANLEIYSITPKTSLGTDETSETKSKKNGIVEERALAYWLTPVLVKEDKILFIIDLYEKKKQEYVNWKEHYYYAVGLSSEYEDYKETCEELKKAYLTGVKDKDKYEKKLFNLDSFKLNKESKIRNDFYEYIMRYEKNDIQAEIKNSEFGTKWMNYMRGVLGRFALHKLNISLLIADEIQNFSEVITMTNNTSEKDALVTASKLFKKNTPVLMMSATPFPIYSKNQEIEDKGEVIYEKSFSGNQYLSNNSNLSNTDVYKEFLKTVEYLLPEEKWNNWMDGKSWRDTWEDYEKIKRAAVEDWKNDKNRGHFADYCKAVKGQENMLRAANILRTERLSVQDGTVFESENEIVPIDRVLTEEILRLPHGKTTIKSRDNIIQYYNAEFYFSWLKTDDENDIEFCTYIKENHKFIEFIFSDYSYVEDEIIHFDDREFNCDVLYKATLYCEQLDYEEYIEYDYSIVDIANPDYKPDVLKESKNNKLQGLGYHKSTPAVFSFSKDYKQYTDTLENNQKPNHTINIDRIKKYEKLFADGKEKTNEIKEGLLYNARVKSLFETIFDKEEQHKLLFIPPVYASEELSGVFYGKKGVSKRLFFSSNKMTTRSLSAILSYEAERRQVSDWKIIYQMWPWLETNKKDDNDYQFGVPVINGQEYKKGTRLVWNSKERRFLFWNFDAKKEETDTSNVVNTLFAYDKSNISDENMGSPYAYAINRDNIFPKIDPQNNKIPEEIDNFCKSYFEYMINQYSLRVLMAYVYADRNKTDGYQKYPCTSLYELIMAYGASGCIHDVFDEYAYASEYSTQKSEDGFAKQALTVFSSPYRVEFEGISESEDKQYSIRTHFAIQHNADMNSNTSDDALAPKIKRFNSPFLPFQFISTSIGQEGFDFHLYCRKIVHWTLTHDPVKFEQREGRINRYHCYANRLRASELCKDWQGWDKLFSELPHDKTGLVPDFVTPMPEKEKEYCNLVREFYYYPESYEAETKKGVLESLGSYRALLGRYGDDNYEDDFDNFAKEYVKNGGNISDFFINLSPLNANSKDAPIGPQPEDPAVPQSEETSAPEEPAAPKAHAVPQTEEVSAPEVPATLQSNESIQFIKDPNTISFSEWYGNDIKTNVINGKVLIVGQISNGRTFLLREAAKRDILAGVEAKTITEIALPIVAEALVKTNNVQILKNIHLDPISHNTACGIILDLIRKNYDISKNILTYNTAEELLRIINMLRMNDQKDCTNSSVFKIGELLEAYEQFLVEHSIYDSTRLIKEAINHLEELHKKEQLCIAELHEYALLDDHTPDFLERKLIELLSNGKCKVISACENAENKMQFFKSYGMMDEVMTVAKEIKSNKLVSGDTAVFFTDAAYAGMIRCIFREINIPVYLTGGRSAEEKDQIRLWLSILNWWKNECRMNYFESILMNPEVHIPFDVEEYKDESEESVNKKLKSGILKYIGDNIGYLFGRHNVIKLAPNEKDISDNKKHSKDYALEFINELTNIFRFGSEEQGFEEYLPLNFLSNGLMKFTEKYCKTDEFFISAQKAMTELFKYLDSRFTFDELYSLLSRQIKAVKLRDTYDPDGVTVQMLTSNKTITPAVNTYIVGMSSSLALKKTDESPIISDDEIGNLLSEKLALKYQGTGRNIIFQASVKYLKASMPNGGALTMSYPYYDQSELRLRSSSGIFEDMYERFGKGSELSDYNSLSFLDDVKSFTNTQYNDERLFALKKPEVSQQKAIRKTELFLKAKELIENNAQVDETQKKETEITDNNEKIKFKLSASTFDTLLNCPRKYYIENKYGIRSEPQENETSGWLKANQKGLLFHAIMEKYINSFCGSEAKLTEREIKRVVYNEDLFNSVFNEVKKEFDIIPFELESDKLSELDEIKKVSASYIKDIEEEQNDGYIPCAVEYKFVSKNKTAATEEGHQQTTACTDNFDGMELEYSIGFLDRIDRNTDKDKKTNFRIVDYKSGSIDNFMRDHKMILVQHYVYQKALQQELGEDGIVDRFEFVFPFDDSGSIYEYTGNFKKTGEAKNGITKIVINGEITCNDKIKEILSEYKKAIMAGNCPTHDVSFKKTKSPNAKEDKRAGVKYCPYKDICGGC